MSVSFYRLRKITFELVEGSGPAVPVAVAGRLVEELLVAEGEERSGTLRFDINAHQRLAFRRRSPGPAEHKLPVPDHFAIDAAHIVLLAIGAAHEDVKAAADARINLCQQPFDLHRSKPDLQFFRVGPRCVDFLGGRIETTFDGEAWFGGDFCSGSHDSFSTNAARRSSCSDQNCR